MGAALTLLILLAVSMVIVRIASVALRLTGLPDHVARFQSISALTGAGFTTTESEAIVNYPIRRRVIVGLMIFGNLGLVSVASTFIVAFASKTGDFSAMLTQAAAIAAAVIFIAIITASKTLDTLLCGLISRVLQNITDLEQKKFHVLLSLYSDYSVSEHVYRGAQTLPLFDIVPSALKIDIISVQGENIRHFDEMDSSSPVNRNESLICVASAASHQKLADHLATIFPAHIHI